MKNPKQKKYTPLLAALATLIVLLAAVVLILGALYTYWPRCARR